MSSEPRPPRALLLCALAAGLLFVAHPALAQQVSIDLGDGQSFSLRTVQLFLLITLLSRSRPASRSW